MSFKTTLCAAMAVASLALPALTLPAMAEIKVEDAYARASGKSAKSGAAFMMLTNDSDTADRLIAVKSDAAKRAELHTHKENADGLMQMIHVEEGFAIPAGQTHMLKRGGDHVMLMGLTAPMAHGDTVTVTLIFEQAGEVTIDVPVDLERKGNHAHKH